jgi:flagellar hook-length control protein FliK
MINFNFLGLGSFSASHQKGKTNGVTGAESEDGSVVVDGNTQISDAAFPNVLMQMLLGQQLPITVQVPSGQQTIPPENGTDSEILVSENPLFISEQVLSLREQSIVGEMKKQSAIQKASVQISPSEKIKTASGQSENIDIAKFPLEELNVESVGSILKDQVGSTEISQILPEPKMNLDGMNILPIQTQPSIIKQSLSIGQEVKETEPSILSKNKLSPPANNLFMNEFVQPFSDTPVSISNNKPETMNKGYQQKEILNAEEIKIVNKTIVQDLDAYSNIQSSKIPLTNNEKPLSSYEQQARNNTIEAKQIINKTIVKEQDNTSIMSNDFLQKGILSAVVTQSGKVTKNNDRKAMVIESTNSSKNHLSSTTSIELDTSATIVKSETQNSGNGSFTPKDNFDRQSSAEKTVAPVDARQGQQLFTAVIEEKNNMIAPKNQQADITSFLRQQDAVNNIVEQLAKNVKFSIDGNNSQIKISLTPEALGEVMLKVSVEHGKVSTQIEVQQPQIKAVVEANIQILRDSLSSKGLVVDRIDISTAQYSLNEKSSNHGQHRSNMKNYSGKEIVEEDTVQTKLFGYNTVDYVA